MTRTSSHVNGHITAAPAAFVPHLKVNIPMPPILADQTTVSWW
jgi:hypothetical protein